MCNVFKNLIIRRIYFLYSLRLKILCLYLNVYDIISKRSMLFFFISYCFSSRFLSFLFIVLTYDFRYFFLLRPKYFLKTYLITPWEWFLYVFLCNCKSFIGFDEFIFYICFRHICFQSLLLRKKCFLFIFYCLISAFLI